MQSATLALVYSSRNCPTFFRSRGAYRVGVVEEGYGLKRRRGERGRRSYFWDLMLTLITNMLFIYNENET